MENSEPREQFERMVREHGQSIFRFCYRSLGDWHEAEDQVNEVFELAWTGLLTLRDVNSAKSWLFSICRHRLANRINRKKKMVFRSLNDNEPLTSVGAGDPLGATDLIQFAAARIDRRWLEVVLLVEMEQFTVDETAQLLSIPRGTVLSRLHRGKKQMREIIELEEARCESKSASR